MSTKYKFPDLLKAPLKGFEVQGTDGRGTEAVFCCPLFLAYVKLTTVRKGFQEPQLISAGIAGPATGRNYHQLKMSEEEGKGSMNLVDLKRPEV